MKLAAWIPGAEFLAYLAINLAVHLWLAHAQPGFDSHGHREKTDSTFYGQIAEYEATKNIWPQHWWENLWPLNYWESVQKINPAYAVAILPKILMLVAGSWWASLLVISNACLVWASWQLLVAILQPEEKGFWLTVARYFFLLNPWTVYLNTQISKEVWVLLALCLVLRGSLASPCGTPAASRRVLALVVGFAILFWMRGWAQTLALTVILPLLLLFSCKATQSKGEKNRWENVLVGLTLLGLLVLIKMTTSQSSFTIGCRIFYDNRPVENLSSKAVGELDPDPSRWSRVFGISNVEPFALQRGSELQRGTSYLDPMILRTLAWNYHPFLPRALENIPANLSVFRAGFLSTPGSSNFARNIPNSTAGFLGTLPQAVWDGVLLPWQDFIFAREIQPKKVGIVCLGFFIPTMALILAALTLVFLRKKIPLQAWAMAAFSLWGMALYGFIILNLGSLVRIRHPLWMIFVGVLALCLGRFRSHSSARSFAAGNRAGTLPLRPIPSGITVDGKPSLTSQKHNVPP